MAPVSHPYLYWRIVGIAKKTCIESVDAWLNIFKDEATARIRHYTNLAWFEMY